MPTFKCPQCNTEFQADHEGRYHCPSCEHTVAIHLHVHGKVPWETWRERGRLAAFWDTWKQVMTNPVGFFKRVSPGGNFVLPMYYGIICQSIAIILMWSYQAGFHSIPTILDYTAAFGGYWPMTANFSWPAMVIFFIALVVIAPVFAAIGIFFPAALYHLCLKILGGANNGFEATFRAVCYGSSAQFLGVIPIVGSVVAGVWCLILNIIGLKEIHKTSFGKAILAVMLPVFICCGFIVLVVAGLFGAAIGAWMSSGTTA